MRNGVDDDFSVAEVLQSHTVRLLTKDFLSSSPSFSSINILGKVSILYSVVVPR